MRQVRHQRNKLLALRQRERATLGKPQLANVARLVLADRAAGLVLAYQHGAIITLAKNGELVAWPGDRAANSHGVPFGVAGLQALVAHLPGFLFRNLVVGYQNALALPAIDGVKQVDCV